MAREHEFLRGLAWNVPASIGAPVDLAETVLNLGLAAGGYAGHKLGLLRPDQLPELLSGSPGTTKWWAKGTPIAESGDPAYQRGQLTGGLTALFAGAMPKIPLQRDSTLRSIFVDPEWLTKHNIPDRGPDGRPLGRFTDVSGAQNVALPRQKSAPETFPTPAATGLRKLADLAPETRGTPLEGVEVAYDPSPGVLAGPNVMGHADFGNNLIVMRTVQPNTLRPYSPYELLQLLHHEATHFADAKRKALATGSWTDRVDPTRLADFDALETLKRQSPTLGAASQRLVDRGPHNRYTDDLGEVKARIAADTSSIIAPSSATLELLARKEMAGREPSVAVSFRNGAGTVLLPAASFRKGGTLEVRPTLNGRFDVWERGNSGGYIGWIDNKHAVGSEEPLLRGLAGGRSAPKEVRQSPKEVPR